MSTGFRYNPYSNSNGGLKVLIPEKYRNNQVKSVSLVNNGKTLETGEYKKFADNRENYWFSQHGGAYPKGTKVRLVTNDGQTEEYDPYEGLKPGEAGPGQGNNGYATPGGSVGGVAFSNDLSALYPTFKPISYDPIKPADYNFTDPQEFAKTFGQFNADNIDKNFGKAKGYALDQLNAELQGLQSFAPAASALKRSETSIDNIFNQEQRLSQVNKALPGVSGTLDDQAARAAAYARGELPDSFQDRALELGVRSGAADAAGFGGFGPKSAASNKLSDLMSAENRFKIAQYGEDLTSNNINTKANLFLAPTEYSDAGTQVRVTPEVGAGRLTSQNLSELNARTLIDPTNALSATISQNQFTTGLEQDTNKFNASNQLTVDSYNSSNQFAAEAGLFNYRVGLDAALTGQNQQVLNNVAAAQIQGINAGTQEAGFINGQNTGTVGSIATSFGSGVSGNNGISGLVGNFISSIASQFTPTNSGGSSGSSGYSAGGGLDPSATNSTNGVQQTPRQELNATSGVSRNAGPATGVETYAPSAFTYSSPEAVPQGYTSVGQNSSGATVAVENSSYRADLERFARSASPRSGGSITIQAAADMDRVISNSTGISYQPAPGLRQIATTASGKQVFSNPGAANNLDYTSGAQNTNGIGVTMSTLGIVDPEMLGVIGQTASIVSNPEILSKIDQVASSSDTRAATQEILKSLGVKNPDLNTKSGQELAAGAGRIAELWPNFSPGQKSMALSSLTKSVIEHKTGTDISKLSVPGTSGSVAGKLQVSDVTNLDAQGKNGTGLARNWNQLSAVGEIFNGSKTAQQIADITGKTGFIGYGPHGSAVEVNAKELAKINAVPAPSVGVGAISIPSGKSLPRGYKAIPGSDNKGRVIAIPEKLASTSPLLSGATAPVHKALSLIDSDKHPVQKNWGTAHSRGVSRGSVGGSAFIAALDQLQKTSPSNASAIYSYSLFSNTLSGQSEE